MPNPHPKPQPDPMERTDGWLLVSLILLSWAFILVFGILIGCGQVGEWLS